MKNKIHYAVEARRDLDDIWDYIVTDLCNASAAERVVNDILDVAEQLESFSEMGALLASIANVDSDYRFLVSGNYLIKTIFLRTEPTYGGGGFCYNIHSPFLSADSSCER